MDGGSSSSTVVVVVTMVVVVVVLLLLLPSGKESLVEVVIVAFDTKTVANPKKQNHTLLIVSVIFGKIKWLVFVNFFAFQSIRIS